jgi:hypothetical protein
MPRNTLFTFSSSKQILLLWGIYCAALVVYPDSITTTPSLILQPSTNLILTQRHVYFNRIRAQCMPSNLFLEFNF